MREIKVRVWNPTLNKMVYEAEEINVNGNGVVLDVSSGKLVAEYRTEEGYWANAEILENTGLKDKNGVEIYEGDIVSRFVHQTTTIGNEDGSSSTRIHTNKEMVRIYGVVSYEEKNAGFTTGNSKIWLGHYDDIEILGNIYANPELLEGDTHA